MDAVFFHCQPLSVFARGCVENTAHNITHFNIRFLLTKTRYLYFTALKFVKYLRSTEQLSYLFCSNIGTNNQNKSRDSPPCYLKLE